MSDLVVTHNGKKLNDGVDYTVLGNIVTPINKELFKDADENGEIELTINYTYKNKLIKIENKEGRRND